MQMGRAGPIESRTLRTAPGAEQRQLRKQDKIRPLFRGLDDVRTHLLDGRLRITVNRAEIHARDRDEFRLYMAALHGLSFQLDGSI